ncbi:MAG: 50S ribosomal protein L7/L12 [Spirochaetales bacterium]|jgi:large subunit ribosomal protein L7/L12|nr:50S ribosomal protein L7/L12 [Spirochaetales bacterium]
MATLTKEEVLDAIAGMTVLEVSELVKMMEEKFGVTAAAPVAVAAPGAGAAAPAAAVEEKTEFTVKLSAIGEKKIEVIKAVRAVVPGLGLKEAKDLVEGLGVIKENASKDESASIKKALEDAGAKVEVQ